MRTGENIYKRRDGRWEARYRKGRDANGRISYGYCYGKTYTEAKEKVAEAQFLHRTEHPLGDPSNISFGMICEQWLMLNRIRLKESTYVKYRTTIDKYLIPAFGGLDISEINTTCVQQFSESLSRKGLATKTIKDILLLFHEVLKYGTTFSPNASTPVKMVYPKTSKKELRVLTPSEQKTLTEYLLSNPTPCSLGILIALWTGIRIGELCALRWDHVNLEEHSIRIEMTMQRLKDTSIHAPARTRIVIDSPKSASAFRTIPLTHQAVELCRQRNPNDPSAYLLTGSRNYMEPRLLQYHFSSIVAACDLKDVHFHTLRHTFATRCVEVDFEIKSLSEILGHANTSITLNRYVHCSMELKRANIKKLEHIGM